MKIRPLTGLMVAILLFGAYTSVALSSQSEYNGGEIKADALENQTPKVYTMKIYVGDSTDRVVTVQDVPAYGVSSGEAIGIKETISDVTGASEPKSSGGKKLLQSLISSVLDSVSTDGKPFDFGSALDLVGSGGADIGSGISRTLDKVQTLSEILTIFSNVLSAI